MEDQFIGRRNASGYEVVLMKFVLVLATVLFAQNLLLGQKLQDPGLRNNSHSNRATAISKHRSSAAMPSGAKTNSSASELAKIERESVKAFGKTPGTPKHKSAAATIPPAEKNNGVKTSSPHLHPASKSSQSHPSGNKSRPGIRGR